MAQKRQRILCVDYNADVREMLAALLGAAGYDATAVAAPHDAEQLVSGEGFDLFILDKVPRVGPGLKLCRELRRRHPHTPIIVYSADVSEHHRREAAEAGATACVDKPDVRPLVSAVEKLISRECRERHCPAARSAARQRVVVGGDDVEDELYGERRRHDAHDAGDDVHLALADARHQTPAQVERDGRERVHERERHAERIDHHEGRDEGSQPELHQPLTHLHSAPDRKNPRGQL